MISKFLIVKRGEAPYATGDASGDGPPVRGISTSSSALGDVCLCTNGSRGLMLSLFLAVSLCLYPAASQSQGTRAMTVRDSVEKADFVGNAFQVEKEVNYSPDGRHFFVIPQRGVLQSNQIEATIWLFSSDGASSIARRSPGERSLQPRALAKVVTTSNEDPIIEARWAVDSQNIAFLGLSNHNDSGRHLFNVNIKDGRVQQLSANGQNVLKFDRAGDRFIFTAMRPMLDSQIYQSGGPTLGDIQIGTGMSLFELLYPNSWALHNGWSSCEVWQVRGRMASPVMNLATSRPISLTGGCNEPLSLSPDGHYAVVANMVSHVPSSWETYEPSEPSIYRLLPDKSDTQR